MKAERASLFRFLNEDKSVLHDVIHFAAEKDDIEVEVALAVQ